MIRSSSLWLKIGEIMKIAIIGYGGMGGWHAERLAEYKNYAKTSNIEALELSGIYDTDEKQKIRAKGKNIKVFSSPEEIWGDEEIEAVLLAVPNDLHKEYTLAAAKAGKHIICEKPIALSSKEAQEMYEATEKAGVIFSVHQNRRWDEDFLTVKKIIKSKQIGEVYLIESRVMGANGIPGNWRKKKAQGGGMMLDWGVHLIDQALQMIESEVESLYCEYSYIYGEEVEDGCALTLNFSNGVKYRIVIATDCFRNLPRWQVYGTEGTATVNDWSITGGITRCLVKKDEKVVGIKAGNGFTRTMAPRDGDTVKTLPLEIVKAEPWAYYKNFVASCRGKEELIIKPDEVLRVFRLMEICSISALGNKVVNEKV
jgi:predicted dehydrogenase